MKRVDQAQLLRVFDLLYFVGSGLVLVLAASEHFRLLLWRPGSASPYFRSFANGAELESLARTRTRLRRLKVDRR